MLKTSAEWPSPTSATSHVKLVVPERQGGVGGKQAKPDEHTRGQVRCIKRNVH